MFQIHKIVAQDFTKAPIFYICAVCENEGFSYIGDISHGEGFPKRRMFGCNKCGVVICES